jgi:hypothetical protein
VANLFRGLHLTFLGERFSYFDILTMKVLDYAVSALAAATDVAQHPHNRAAVGYPTLGLHAPREPIQTPTVTTFPSQPPVETQHGIQVIRARSVVAKNQTADASKVCCPIRARFHQSAGTPHR